MCSWRILYMCVPILIGFYITEYRKDILNLIRMQSNPSKFRDDKLDLIIYIPSARENFDKRQAIRETWASVLNSTSSLPVTLRFVVGDKACAVHKDYRVDEFGCEEWFLPALSEVNNRTRHAIKLTNNRTRHAIKLTKRSMDNDQIQNNKNKENNNVRHDDDHDHDHGDDDEDEDEGVYPVQRIEFIVHHEVVVWRLGVHEVCLQGGSVVRLLEASSLKEIASVTFDERSSSSSSSDSLSSSSSFSFKNLDMPYILPKGFKGVVTVENMKVGNTMCEFKYWDFPWHSIYNSSSVIQFINPPIIPAGTYLNEDVWDRRPFTVVNFAYKLYEMKNLKDRIDRRGAVQKALHVNISLQHAALERESAQHADLMFVPLVDVYRNLPSKFLLFAQVMADTEARMVLKVDDDSYLDLEAVLKVIRSVDHRDNVWLGRFRHNWPINDHGKWADHDFSSPTYPRFACGSGYILTQGLLKWLGRNSESLKIYQGEDVSMGIWLSAVEHRIIDDPLWQCDKECISDMYSMPDLRPDLLKVHWAAKVKCGDPCGCD